MFSVAGAEERASVPRGAVGERWQRREVSLGPRGWGRTRGAAEERPRSAAPSAPRGSGAGRGSGHQQRVGSCPREPRRRWSGQPASHCGCLRAGSFLRVGPDELVVGGNQSQAGAARTRGGPGTVPAGPASRGGSGPGPARTPAVTGAPPALRRSEACGQLRCGARARLVLERR